MKLGLMQPYLFPYIGYFQLIANCDLFVIYDDVQYIKGGWINRNRILLNATPHYITLPLRNDSFRLNINQRFFAPGFEKHKKHLLEKVQNGYRKAPFFASAYKLVRECLQSTDENVASFTTQTIKRSCQYLDITTPFAISSEIPKDPNLLAEDRVLSINKVLKSDVYINPVGGVELYQREHFARQGITLQFIRTKNFQYSQFAAPFIPFLSIIDVMMFNSKEQIRKFLTAYELF